MGRVIYPEWEKRAGADDAKPYLADLCTITATEQDALNARFGPVASGLIASLSIVAEHAEGGLKNTGEIRKRLINHDYPDDVIEEVIGILEAPVASPFNS